METSSKACRYRTGYGFWACDWWREWKRSAMLDFGVLWLVESRGKGSHVWPYKGGVNHGCGTVNQRSGSQKTPEAEVKMSKFLFGEENLPERVFYKRERGPGPSVTAGVPFFLSHNETMSRWSCLGFFLGVWTDQVPEDWFYIEEACVFTEFVESRGGLNGLSNGK